MNNLLIEKLKANRDYISDISFSNTSGELISVLPDSLISNKKKAGINISIHSERFNNLVHSHDFFEVIYVYKGNVTDLVNGTLISLKQGEACIHNPNAVHSIINFDEKSDIVFNILISKEMFRKSFYSMLFQDENLDRFFNHYMSTSNNAPAFMAFHNLTGDVGIVVELLIKNFFEEEGYSRMVLESTLMMLFGEFLREYRLRESDKQIVEIFDYISENLSVATLLSTARHFGYHPKYFSSFIRKKTGRNFMNLLIDLKLRKAATYLEFTDYSIDQIVELIGYKDNSSLYNNFKAYYHLTPKDFRELKHKC